MTQFAYPTTVEAALAGADQLLLLAPEKALSSDTISAALPAPLRETCAALCADHTAGPHGRIRESWTAGQPRRVVAGSLPQTVSRHNAPNRRDAIFELSRAAKLEGVAAVIVLVDDAAHALPAAAGVASAHPLYDLHANPAGPKELRLLVLDATGAARPLGEAQQHALTALRDVARQIDTPAEDMTTAAMADEAERAARELPGVEMRVIEGDDLIEAGLTSLHAVGRTAPVAPRMVILDTGPRGSGPTTALVGKGIVYDTGGLFIKGRGGMDHMKCDMGGAAAVLGAFRILARESLDRRVFALLPLAENSVGPDSYRPGDIIRTHAGFSVEINNTDAEGRLVLADGVSYAARVLDAQIIIDAATLTGAQMVATGHRHAGVVSNDADLEALAVRAGLETGEMAHPLPFAPEFYQREFTSKVADMKNSVKDRSNAQSSCAAQFIWRQIDDLGRRWLHVDFAGPAFRDERGTGFGALLLAHIVAKA